MKSFEFWKKRFAQNDLLDFSQTEEGLLWLKLRSIERKDLLASFGAILGVTASKDVIECIWQKLNSDDSAKVQLLNFMQECQKRENEKIDSSFETIRSNLYKMTHFHWGGDFRNSLDKAIITRFVKTDEIIPYEDLDKICEGKLLEMSRGYLLNSWYNYWSSVLIENQFRRNANVMPAYGKIKNVDFFVKDFPFDLKVTYIPKAYAKIIRKNLEIEEPLKKLKYYAKKTGIIFDSTGDDEQIQYELTEKIIDSDTVPGKELLEEIKREWSRTVDHIIEHKTALIKWLYENQGDMRFGAENRIFLVLVDKKNPNEAWKLKRNIDLIKPVISEWVKNFNRTTVKSMLISFDYNKRNFQTYADMIFACKDSI